MRNPKDLEPGTLTLMVGLPRSGKSTLALRFDCPVVDPDAIRLAMHGKPFVPETERMVWTMAHYMVRALFLTGHTHVVLDSTSMTKARRADWKDPMWRREYALVETPKEVCIQRAIDTDQAYLVPVIEKMANEFEPVEDSEYD